MSYPLSEPDALELLDVATEAAVAAGTHALDHVSRRNEIAARTKHDVKLRLDIECQTVAERIVRSKYPEHRFLGEENTPPVLTGTRNGRTETDSPYLWIVDPIDGTVNFSHGLPHWCCSVACRKRDETVVGVVYAPALNRLYQASAETQAVCNEQPVRVSTVDTLSRAMALSAMDMDLRPGHEPLSLFRDIALHAQKGRILGAAALDLCMVAAGAADAYFEARIYEWDIAAGDLIVRRAGGATEALRQPDDTHNLAFLATNGRIHDELRALVLPGL